MISRATRYAIFLIALALPASAASGAATPAQWLAARVAAAGAQPQPVFIASYDVIQGKSQFDTANATAAFTYDQAMAIMALVAAGDVPSARRLGDALVYAQGHDRKYHDGRLRNAYLAGPTGEGTVKLPGYWNKEAGQWYEDPYQDGQATGNNAWACVALLRLFNATGDQTYAAAARGIGDYLLTLKDGHDGLPGGYERYDDAPETLTWRSAEHNTAVLACMRLLEAAYPGQGFGAEADSAQRFLVSAVGRRSFSRRHDARWRYPEHCLFRLRRANPWPCWPCPTARHIWRRLTYAERVHGVPGGFDYSSAKKGIWAEGTMEAATLYTVLGDTHAGGRPAGGAAER